MKERMHGDGEHGYRANPWVWRISFPGREKVDPTWSQSAPLEQVG